MTMKRVSAVFRSPSSPAGPSPPEKLPMVGDEDEESVNTEIADVKSQQTTVTPLSPPNLKIKVRPAIISHFPALTTALFYSASIIITLDGEVGSTRTPVPKLWRNRARL